MVSFFSILILYAARTHTGSRLFNKMKNSLMHKETDTFFPLHCIKLPHYCTSFDMRRSLETLKRIVKSWPPTTAYLGWNSLIVTNVKKKTGRGGKYIFWTQLFTGPNKQNTIGFWQTEWHFIPSFLQSIFFEYLLLVVKYWHWPMEDCIVPVYFVDVELEDWYSRDVLTLPRIGQHTLDMASALW